MCQTSLKMIRPGVCKVDNLLLGSASTSVHSSLKLTTFVARPILQMFKLQSFSLGTKTWGTAGHNWDIGSFANVHVMILDGV